MKRTLALLFLVAAQLALLASPTMPWLKNARGPSGAGGEQSYTIVVNNSAGVQSGDIEFGIGDFNEYEKRAKKFTAPESFTATKVVLPLKKVGSPSFTITASIYSNNSGVPGTLIGTASSSVSASALATSYADIEFTGLSASLTNSTVYWVVFSTSTTTTNGTDYVQTISWQLDSAELDTHARSDFEESSWTLVNSGGGLFVPDVQIYKSP